MPDIPDPDEILRLRRRVRLYIIVFIVGLVLSGVTAFPLVAELELMVRWMGITGPPEDYTGAAQWIARVHQALQDADTRYPFLFYGTDWLAFGHLIIALFFVGPLRDPVRNIFVLRAGVAACILVFPLAFICGPIRGIPFYWQLIDCSFGLIGMIPLLLCLRDIQRLEAAEMPFPSSGR